jgi:hypothetical protein
MMQKIQKGQFELLGIAPGTVAAWQSILAAYVGAPITRLGVARYRSLILLANCKWGDGRFSRL